MTNKVKPFYIRITDDMTPQMVQDAFDKCVDAGAALDEGCSHTNSRYEYKRQYNPSLFKFFGVDDSHMTYMDIDLEFFMDAQEITLDQLDEWLGLSEETDWNGEGLPPVGVECEWIGGGLSHGDWGAVIVRSYNDDYAWIEKLHDKSMHTVRNPAHFRKPETHEQKAGRERVEAAYDLYLTRHINANVLYRYDEFLKNKGTLNGFLAIVDKTGYRKQ